LNDGEAASLGTHQPLAAAYTPGRFFFLRFDGRFFWRTGFSRNSTGRPYDGPMPTEPVLPEGELRSRALQRIANGELPCVLSTRIDAGYGTRQQCDLCDQLILPIKIEYDVIAPGTGRRLHFHLACHTAWQRECAVLLRNPSSA
jgi:hypothetical protein